MRRPDHITDYNEREEQPYARWYKKAWWYAADDDRVAPTGNASALIWHRSKGHGVGFQFGMNGSESDIGLDLYLGKIASVWLRYQSPRTKRFRIEGDYDARHIGIMLHPHDMAWMTVDIMAKSGSWSRSDPWWMHNTLNIHTIFGRVRSEKVDLDGGVCQIPMPEGVYEGLWARNRYVSSYVGPLGKIRDRILGPKTSNPSYWIEIPGGIPCYGKGENSWDCGMDGIFGTGGRTIEDAIGNVVSAATRERNRHGDPKLDSPMTVIEAEKRESA